MDEALWVFALDAPQRQVNELLIRLVGPGPAAYFRDACILMSPSSPIIATTHLVAHMLREIESAICSVLPSVSVGVAGDGDGNHAYKIRAILRGLEIDEQDPIAKAWLANRGNYHKYAHRNALDAPRRLDSTFVAFWNDTLSVVAGILERFEPRFSTAIELIDQLLALPTPNTGDAKRLRNNIPRTTGTTEYFFNRLIDARWLQPLQQAGFFKDPFEAYETENGEFITPSWPESRYLARIAALSGQPSELGRL